MSMVLPFPDAVDHMKRPIALDRLGPLFEAHHQRLFRLARRFSQDPEEALDLVQETFLRAARSSASLPEGAASEEAWLVRILINLGRDGYRRREVAARAQRVLEEGASSSHDPRSASVARAAVQAALAQLRPRRRAIVILHELEEMPVKDIARLLGITQTTVRWHLFTGRKTLARILQCDPAIDHSGPGGDE